LLKVRVADRQHFINYKDLRIQVRGHGKSKSQIHPAGVVFDGRIEKSLDFSEGNYFVKSLVDLAMPHSEYRAVQIYILAPAQIGMKPRADFKQARNAAVQLNASAGWLDDSRKDFEKRGLAGSVSTYDTHNFARHDFEADVSQRPHGVVAAVSLRTRKRRLHCLHQRFAQCIITHGSFFAGRYPKLLADAVDFYDCLHF